MNIFLWILQVLLALHTAVGAFWKFSNSEQAVPTLKAIPHSFWIVLIVIELLCSLGLVIPIVSKSLGSVAPIAAIVIAAEMLLFCGVHFSSGANSYHHIIYWLVVAAVSAFIAYGRLVMRPL